MADETTSDNELVDNDKQQEEYERSAQNRSLPDPASRDLWQSANVSTDGNGPRVEDVTPIFDQARVTAFGEGNVVTADDDDEEVERSQEDVVAEAQERVDAWRESTGYVAPTGADAGQYDDPRLEGQVPSENFSAAPEAEEDERRSEDAKSDDVAGRGSFYTDGSQINAGSPNGEQVSTDDKKDELRKDQSGGATPANAEATTPDSTNTESNPPESTPEAPTSNDGDANKDITQDDLTSDTAGEQGGLDETSADNATPKTTRAKRSTSK